MSMEIKLQKKNVTPNQENQYLTFDDNGNQIAKTFETNFYPVLHVNTDENCDIRITNGKFIFNSSYTENKIFKPTDSDGVLLIDSENQNNKQLLYVTGNDGDNDFLITELGEWTIELYNNNVLLKTKTIDINNINYYSMNLYPFQCDLIIKAPPGITVICQKEDKVYYSDTYNADKEGYIIQVLEPGNWNVTVKSSLETSEGTFEITSEDNYKEKIITCSIHLVPDDVFGNNDWDVISWASYTGNIPEDAQGNPKWKIGDYKVVEIDSAVYHATIIGINHNRTYEGNNTIHLQLFKFDDNANKCVTSLAVNNQYSNINGSIVGGYSGDYSSFNWNKTYLYNFISNTNRFNLPRELWNVIRPSIKYTTRIISGMSHVSSSLYHSYPIKTETKIFLLSPIEVGIGSYDSSRKDINQEQYDYYKTNTQSRRNLSSDWWLRRPTARSTSAGWGLVQWEYSYVKSDGTNGGTQFIGPNGTISDIYYIEKGISPCFVV